MFPGESMKRLLVSTDCDGAFGVGSDDGVGGGDVDVFVVIDCGCCGDDDIDIGDGGNQGDLDGDHCYGCPRSDNEGPWK